MDTRLLALGFFVTGCLGFVDSVWWLIPAALFFIACVGRLTYYALFD
jgi:hypothetical protein